MLCRSEWQQPREKTLTGDELDRDRFSTWSRRVPSEKVMKVRWQGAESAIYGPEGNHVGLHHRAGLLLGEEGAGAGRGRGGRVEGSDVIGSGDRFMAWADGARLGMRRSDGQIASRAGR